MRRAVLLVPVALPLAACGGGGAHTTTTTAGNPLAAAAAKTRAAGSEHTALQATVTLSGQAVKLSGTGAFDNTADEGTLDGKLDLGTGGSTPFSEVIEGKTLYLRSGLFGSLLGGKSWLAIDLTKSTQAFGFDLGALGGQDPDDVLDQLSQSSGATVAGHDTIDGASTTHYHTSTADAWVDGNDLVRKVHLDYTTKGSKGSSTHVVLDLTLSDFGAKVHATPPPANETVDSGDLTK